MIYEMRKVKGIFLENLELNDFPVDVQVKRKNIFFQKLSWTYIKDLTITVSTTRTVNEVLLMADTSQLSAINTRKKDSDRKTKTEFLIEL